MQKDPSFDKVSFLTDSYVLASGTYKYVDLETGRILKELTVDKKLDKENVSEEYELFAKLDYLSILINMDKPIDLKKVIHSNNFYSFFIKKESLKEKLTLKRIDEYYEILKNPAKKYSKDKKKNSLYLIIEEEVGKANEINLEKCKKWIKNNIFLTSYGDEKDYLKIFFNGSMEEYKKESQKYIMPNIYNKCIYNIEIDGKIHGLPNNNINMNNNKQYLYNKTRKNTVPLLVNIEEILEQKYFFDYLLNLVNNKKYNIYFDQDKEIYSYGNDEILDLEKEFIGYFLRIKRETSEAGIYDYDRVSIRNTESSLEFKNYLDLEVVQGSKISYGNLRKAQVYEYVDKIFYSGYLKNNLYTEIKDLPQKEVRDKEIFINTRDLWNEYFYKDRDFILKEKFKKMGLDIIKNTINKNYLYKSKEQFNLYLSMCDYFYEEDSMGEKMKIISEELYEKIDSKEYYNLKNDEEFYYGIGQLIFYLLGKNKSSEKYYSLLTPVINCKNINQLKRVILRMFNKYSYDISLGNKKFNNLYRMVTEYEVKEKKINEQYILGGFLGENLIYKKGEKEDDEE